MNSPRRTDPKWHSSAACRDEDPELFFPIGNTDAAQAQADSAKVVCNTCTVIDDCREWALATREKSGVWGGLDEAERRSLLRRNARRRTTAAA